jgi:hypothetical protein
LPCSIAQNLKKSSNNSRWHPSRRIFVLHSKSLPRIAWVLARKTLPLWQSFSRVHLKVSQATIIRQHCLKYSAMNSSWNRVSSVQLTLPPVYHSLQRRMLTNCYTPLSKNFYASQVNFRKMPKF